MIKKLITYLLVILFGIVSCKKKDAISEKVNSEKITQEKLIDSSKIKATKNQIVDSVPKISQSPKDLKSYLKNKVERLSKLEHNYIIKDFGLIKVEKTRLIRGLERLIKSDFNKPVEIENINIDTIKNSIIESRFAFIKATKSKTPNGNTFPRATITEYIFKNQDIANSTFSSLSELREIDRIWYRISKEPNSILLEDNRLYYVSTGGWYMMDIYKEIENEIKKRP